jgi:hypothetical protein
LAGPDGGGARGDAFDLRTGGDAEGGEVAGVAFDCEVTIPLPAQRGAGGPPLRPDWIMPVTPV